uniref:Uncharacterized protein n=1 Tax=Arundo donax TaxID=35708 RepID=A0A0A9EPV9_ARUDO
MLTCNSVLIIIRFVLGPYNRTVTEESWPVSSLTVTFSTEFMDQGDRAVCWS